MKTEKQKIETVDLSAVATVQTHLPSTEVIGAADVLDSDDIRAPRLTLCHALSKIAQKGAVPGNFYDSVDVALLGTNDKPVEVIVFDVEKVWTKLVNKQPSGSEPYTRQNAGRQLEETGPHGEAIRWQKTFVYRVLVVGRVGEKIDPAVAQPYLLSLRGTSMPAAKDMNTIFSRMKTVGVSSCAKVFKLTSGQEVNDSKQPYLVHKVELSRDATPQEFSAAIHWCKTMRAVNVVAVGDDDHGDDAEVPF